ncbi:MAG: hypothetical protein ACREQ4_07855 [Candidatus Binataceae bacterium]
MQTSIAGAIAGVIGGAVMAGAMTAGRNAGIVSPTLTDLAKAWLDRNLNARHRVGESGTSVLEQLNYMAASSIFGIGYAHARRYFDRFAPAAAGAIFGGGLYALNLGGIASLIGLTHGERNYTPQVTSRRLGMHILYGVVTAVVADRLMQASGQP